MYAGYRVISYIVNATRHYRKNGVLPGAQVNARMKVKLPCNRVRTKAVRRCQRQMPQGQATRRDPYPLIHNHVPQTPGQFPALIHGY